MTHLQYVRAVRRASRWNRSGRYGYVEIGWMLQTINASRAATQRAEFARRYA